MPSNTLTKRRKPLKRQQSTRKTVSRTTVKPDPAAEEKRKRAFAAGMGIIYGSKARSVRSLLNLIESELEDICNDSYRYPQLQLPDRVLERLQLLRQKI